MNPFIDFAQDPISTSALLAYALILIAALLATWYVLGRKLPTLYSQWGASWILPPGPWMARAIAVPLILAVDALLFGALVWVFTG